MAWGVKQGTWKGVDVAGLCVAAAVQADNTFTEDNPTKARAVLIVDSRADERQRSALIDMAKTLGGTRVANRPATVVATRMQLKLETPHGDEPAGARGARDAPDAPGLVLGGRGRPDRDPTARRARPLLRQRGRRLPAAVEVGRGQARLHPGP